ncbi:MAG: alpha-glucosidase C-terminal domain-containing protein, partial [Pyramidobacter sp.]|nr:alpha-glucosidase C-terminal domain-containing protein [Pyramidobacter sp.]
YPWGKENQDLLAFYRGLGQIRKTCDCLKDGTFHTVSEMLSCLAFERANGKDEILVILNRNDHPITYHLPDHWHYAQCVFGGKRADTGVALDALDSVILRREK